MDNNMFLLIANVVLIAVVVLAAIFIQLKNRENTFKYMKEFYRQKYFEWEEHLFNYLNQLNNDDLINKKVFNKEVYAEDRFRSFIEYVSSSTFIDFDDLCFYEESFRKRLQELK